MTASGCAKYAYVPRNIALGPDWNRVTDANFHSTFKSHRKAIERSDGAPDWADDLLRLARIVFLVDKRVRRDTADDGWTRDIELHVELSSADRWQQRAVSLFEALLRMVTADSWQLSVIAGGGLIDGQRRLLSEQEPVEVALLSGGLDSIAHAAQRARQPGERLLLIGSRIGDTATAQNEAVAAIEALARREVSFHRINDQPFTGGHRSEPSSRSRGLLFAATAIYVAAAYGSEIATMPENGQLAINPPLTTARLGACSTRSVHPWVLAKFNAIIDAIGGTTHIYNPYLNKTKGDVCAIARDAGISAGQLADTVSCGTHGGMRGSRRNCGHCYPCLIRRSGLIAALGFDPTHYSFPLDYQLSANRRSHLADLWQWMERPYQMPELIADQPLPSQVSKTEILRTLHRGREEIRSMLNWHLGDVPAGEPERIRQP